jgi:hypothetical protein
MGGLGLMPAGDAQRVWFPEMLEELKVAWSNSMPWDELADFCARMTELRRQLRSERGIQAPRTRCSKCGKVSRSDISGVSIRSALFALRNSGVIRWRTRLTEEWDTLAVSMSWESWSISGEACIENRLPSDSGGTKLAEYLWWTLRELASHCRRVYDATGFIPFEIRGPRTPSAFAKALDHWFDLALLDPLSMRERARRLGSHLDTGKWPTEEVEDKDAQARR